MNGTKGQSNREKLLALQIEIAEKEHIQSKLHILKKEREELEYLVSKLGHEKAKEEADVDKMSHGSLLKLFLILSRSYDKKLSKEQEEVAQAAVRYDAAQAQLLAVESELRQNEAKLAHIGSCEREYKKLLTEQEKQLLSNDTALAGELQRLQECIAAETARKKEITEAIDAGNKAKSLTDSISKLLSDAGTWGTLDIIGGGLVSDMLKHEKINQAQKQVESLQAQLRSFKTELADVNQTIDVMPIAIDSFTKFADFFFDDIFTAISTKKKIDNALGSVNQTRTQIERVMTRLTLLLSESERKLGRYHAELEATVKASM